MQLLLRSLAFFVVLAGAPLLRAQVTVTVTATPNGTSPGYTFGTSYTFIFTTGASFTTTSIFNSNNQRYFDGNTATDDQLWSTLSGTGLGGSYVRPAGDPGDPYSDLRAYYTGTNNGFQVVAASDMNVTLDIGKLTLDSNPINQINVDVTGGNLPTFLFPLIYVSPSSYFATYNGTYTGFSTSQMNIYYAEYLGNYVFTVSSVTISAIPEPSTYAAIFGSCTCLAVAWRRRTLGLVILHRRQQA